MSAVLNVLAEVSLSAAVIAVSLLLIKKAFFRQFSATMHFALWLLLIVRLMLPFTIDTGIHFIKTPDNQTSINQTTAQQPQIADTHKAEVDDDLYQQTQSSDKLQEKPQVSTTSVKTNPSWKLDDILFAVWIGGILVMLLFTAVAYVTAVRKIKMASINMSSRLLAVFEQEKERMKIRRGVRLKLVSGFHTPALFFPGTVLIPFECLTAMSERELALSIRHELTHYKRKDQWLGLLLVLLQAVYWFHPLVWLAFWQIRIDMEAACDAAVVSRMRTDEKSLYASTILSCMPVKKQYALIGMAGSSRRRTEKRILNIFNNNRTNYRGRIVTAVAAVILFVACFTTACQPTPEQPVVAAKNDSVIEKVLEEPAAPIEKYEAPTTWKDEYTNSEGKLTISVDADVEVPDVDAFPVYKAEPLNITAEQVRLLSDLLFGDADVEGVPSGWPKDKLEEALITFKKDYADSNPMNMTEEEYQQGVKRMEQNWADAPETMEPMSVDDTMTGFESTGRAVLQADIGGTKPAKLIVTNDERFGSNATYFKEDGTSYEVLTWDKETTGLELSEADAIKMAEQFISRMGLDDMSVAATDIGVEYGSEGDDTTNSPRCYIIWFTRTVDGILTTYDEEGGNAVDETSPDSVWEYERIGVGVDDNGIVQLRWSGNAMLSDKLSENVTLLPFDEIKSRFEQGMKNAYIWQDDPSTLEVSSTISTHFDIDRVTLGMMRIKQKDNAGYSLVPVWDFFGKETTVWKNADGQPETGVSEEKWRSWLTINAIDGAVINRTFGY